MNYKLCRNSITNEIEYIELTKDNNEKCAIPLCEANTDFQEYLEWYAKGNTPEEAE